MTIKTHCSQAESDMTVREILIAPDPRLKKKAPKVDRVSDGIRKLMDDMLETMCAANGIGLAAPQIGVLKRVIVMNVSPCDAALPPLLMANPEIFWASEEKELREEGCLSLPEQYAEVLRPLAIKVRYLDQDNKVCKLQAEGLLGICIQHEIDHLDGKLFIDRLSALKRSMILRRLQKQNKTPAAAPLRFDVEKTPCA